MTTLIEQFITQTKEKDLKVAVVGDAMIDEYYQVSATRMSPEFPIPVMQCNNAEPESMRPGGAANVAYQFQNWNCSTRLFSLLDPDAWTTLRKMLIDISGSVKIFLEEPRIPRKRRLYDGNHPTFRWDVEAPLCGFNNANLAQHQMALLQQFADSFKGNPQAFDVAILSDYGKGVFEAETGFLSNYGVQPWITCGVPTIVDPKGGDLKQWTGCTIFKPNSVEAERLSGGIKDVQKQCRFFANTIKCDYVVITEGGNGVTAYFRKEDKFFCYRPPQQTDAKSVIGAGDCFVAFLAMAYGQGFNIQSCIEIAFKAGACYVKNDRNTPITPVALLKSENPIAAKFMMPPPAHERNYTLVFTNGCFDLLHTGHLSTLIHAKSLGQKLVVGVNSDESVRKLKGPERPFVSCEDRMKMLACLDFVDYVVKFDDETPFALIDSIKPDVLVKGGQYMHKNVVGTNVAKEICFAKMLEGYSTTELVQKIRGSAAYESSANEAVAP